MTKLMFHMGHGIGHGRGHGWRSVPGAASEGLDSGRACAEDPDMEDGFDAVHTVEDYYDGPRAGVADFEGAPHYYRSIYLDLPAWNADEDRFELSPVGSEVVDAARELAAIFERWESTRQSTPGFAWTDEEFGALPAERGRRRELEQFLELSYAAAAKVCRVLVQGEFVRCDRSGSGLRVRWRRMG